MKAKLLNFLLVLVSFSIALGFGELALRLTVPSLSTSERNGVRPLEGLIEFDTKLQTRYRRNVSGLVKSQYGEFEIKYTTNALGLRDRPLESDGRQRILVLGNSLVEGWGVEEEAGLVRVAEQTLNQSRSQPLRLINAGMSGFGAAQSYLLGSELLKQVKPNAVVFVYISTMVQADHQFLLLADRDVNNLASGLSGDALLNSPSKLFKTASIIPEWLQTAAQHSAAARLGERLLASRAARNAIQPGDPMTDLLAGLRADKEKLAALHAPSLEHVSALAQRAKAQGLPFLMIHLPMPHQLSADEWLIGRAAYGLASQIYPADDVEIVQSFCRANQLSCASAHGFLAQAISNGPVNERFYYGADFHPTATGYRAIGLWLATQLGRFTLPP